MYWQCTGTRCRDAAFYRSEWHSAFTIIIAFLSAAIQLERDLQDLKTGGFARAS
jgi:hypothetical protein